MLTVAELRSLFTADTRDIDRAQDRIRKDTQRTQGVLKTATGTMAGFLGADLVRTGGRAVIGLLKGSADAASDLNETLNMSATIFGRQEAAMEKWAAGSDRALGLSRQSALDSAASFGDMFRQIGIGGPKAAQLSRTVVQLAADFGSFKNLKTEDVLERIAGGFRGEYDALQLVIPNISAARVEQEALTRTHKKTAKELTAADKALATLAILQKDGARAQGDFARTSTGAANQQKILAAQVENTKAKIGTALLPAYRSMFQWTNDKVVPAVNDFIDGMQNGTGAGGDFVDMLHDIGDAGKKVVDVVDAIPGPVKKTGLEMAVLGYGVFKLSSGVDATQSAFSAWKASLSDSDTLLAKVSKTSRAFGGVLGSLAGAGGLLAVQDGAKKTDKVLGTLESTLGGAAAGFAIGGPVGAAVGALGGLTTSLLQTHHATKVSIGDWHDYIDTLSDVTGATTAATRAMAAQRLTQSGVLKTTRAAGLADTAVVDAIVKGGKARKQVIAALNAEKTAIDASIQAKERELDANVKVANDMSVPLAQQTAAANRAKANRQEIESLKSLRTSRSAEIDGVLKELGAVDKSIEQKRHLIQLSREYDKSLRGLPKAVVTDVKAMNTIPTLRDIAELTRRYKLTPTEVQTLLKATHVKATVDDVNRVIAKMEAYAKLHPTATVDATTKPARDKVSVLVKDLHNLLSGNFTALVQVHTTGGGGGGKGGKKGGGGGSGSDQRTAGGVPSAAIATYAGLTGTPLEILEQQQTIRDIQRQLTERKKLKGGKKGGLVAKGLDRQVLLAQLDEARADLAKLMSAKIDQDAIDAIKQAQADAAEAYQSAVSAIADQLKQSQGIFSSGATTARQLARSLHKSEVTNAQWATLLAQLAGAGLSEDLMKQFIAEGPSAQALKLGRSILATGNVSDINNTLNNLATQNSAIGNAGASGNYAGLGSLFTIENFNSYGMSPTEVAQRLYFTAQVQG